MIRLRPKSLLWTFAGVFLLVLVVATVVQGLFAVTILKPIAERLQEGMMERLTREVAAEIAAAPDVTDHEAISKILRQHQPDERWVSLVYRTVDGDIVMPRPGPNDRMGPPPRGGDWPGPPDTTIHRRWGRRFADLESNDRRFTTRYPVETPNGVIGEVIASAPRQGFTLRPQGAPWHLLFVLPLAIVLAGAGGFILFRYLLRRIRALEHLALQVAEGDLTVRVQHSGRDEIDRVGEQLNRMTERLAESRDHVEHMDRQRRRLLADISHELSTPLTSIRGYAETLSEPGMPLSEEERHQYLANILDEAQRMGLLVNDLLELARLESGSSSLSPERLDWAALCRNTIDRYRSRFEKAGLHIEGLPPGLEAWIVADGRRLEQMFENLLTNALRYVPSGGTVTVALQEIEGERLRLTVNDDGPGFPEDDLPHVFDRFYRADPARSDSGTGLGLAIVREIAHQHGGSASAGNQAPAGAAISVELPIE